MREILFRGKRLQGGEWVEGYFFKSDINKKERESGKATMIFTPDCDTFIMVPECHNSFMVVSDTVGQYTGLKDKHGKRIFEGDILRWTGEDGETGKVIVIFAGGSFLLKCVEVLDAPADPFDEFDRGGQTLEVIGNIHDNPELLKGGEG